MPDLSELYQQVILDHNRSPRNFRAIDNPTHSANGDNPVCGDKITVFLRLDGDRIEDLSFQGKGCAISKASASIMTETLRGKTVQDAAEVFRRFHETVTGVEQNPDMGTLGKLAVFHGVSGFPARVKCATLSWHTLNAALDAQAEAVSTE